MENTPAYELRSARFLASDVRRLVVKEGDVEGFAAAMLSLLNNPDKLHSMGRAAFAGASTNWPLLTSACLVLAQSCSIFDTTSSRSSSFSRR